MPTIRQISDKNVWTVPLARERAVSIERILPDVIRPEDHSPGSLFRYVFARREGGSIEKVELLWSEDTARALHLILGDIFDPPEEEPVDNDDKVPSTSTEDDPSES